MKLHSSLKLLSVFVCLVLIFPAAHSFATETKIEGRILESAGDRVKIEYQGDYMPNIGDPVEIGFKAKSDFIPLKGQWRIVKADSQFVWAKAQGRTEEPPMDYLAIIHSRNPRKKAKEGKLSTTTHTPHPSSTPNVVKRDGRYVAYANGIVKDTRTGLEWKAGLDRDMNWYEARSWVRSLNLDGGGWRMPTIDELKGIYKKRKGTTYLLKTSGRRIWSGETNSFGSPGFFSTYSCERLWSIPGYSNKVRAFAVRSQ